MNNNKRKKHTWHLEIGVPYILLYCSAAPKLRCEICRFVDALIHLTVSYSLECIFKTSLPISDVP